MLRAWKKQTYKHTHTDIPKLLYGWESQLLLTKGSLNVSGNSNNILPWVYIHGFSSCHGYYSVAMLHMHIVTKCYAGSLRVTPYNTSIIETLSLNIAIIRATTVSSFGILHGLQQGIFSKIIIFYLQIFINIETKSNMLIV